MDKCMGLDAHAASCTLAVVSGSGRRLRELVLDTDAGALGKAVRAIRGRRHLCLEEGTHSGWLYEILEPCVDELVVTRGRGTRGVKDDRHDAFALAEALRVGQLDEVIYKLGRRLRLLRELARTHRMISGDLVRVRNRVKATFRARGVATAGRGVYRRSERKAWLAKLDPASRAAAALLLEQLDALVDLDAESTRQLVGESHRHPISRVLETAPGIGPIRAAELMAVVFSPHRFRTAKQFLSYSGLGIVTRSSADWVREGGQWIRAKVPRTVGLNRRHNQHAEDGVQGGGDDGDFVAQLPTASRSLRSHARGRDEAESGQADDRASDRNDRVGDVQERGGVRSAAVELRRDDLIARCRRAEVPWRSPHGRRRSSRVRGRAPIDCLALHHSKRSPADRLGSLGEPNEAMAENAQIEGWFPLRREEQDRCWLRLDFVPGSSAKGGTDRTWRMRSGSLLQAGRSRASVRVDGEVYP